MAVEKLEIMSRRPAAGGHEFGAVGSYEYIQGTASFAVDPAHPANRCINDIALAPKGAGGLVRFSAAFSLLQPTDPSRGSRRLLVGIPNRGRKVALNFNYAPLTPEPEEGPDLGDGFLMRQGYTVAECGWEWCAPAGQGLMTIDLPEAEGPEGPLSGKAILEWQPDAPRLCLSFSEGLRVGLRSYPAANLDDAWASLTVRDHQLAPRQAVNRSLWQFAKIENGRTVPDPTHVCLPSGFLPGKIYELVYEARGAPVVGLGLLAIRDFVAFLKHAWAEQDSPCAGSLDYAYAYGISQSGRFLRHYLYLGLDEDEDGRLVFDGILAHVAGGRRGRFNHRFDIPADNNLFGPENLFPFADVPQTDPLTGQTDGLLSRPARRGKLPKIFYTNSATEYWRGDGSLIHIDALGKQDIPTLDAVRIYLLAGTQHVPASLPLTNVTTRGDRARYALNVLDYWPLMRAALVNLHRWAADGIEPPPSAHPRLSDGSAVRGESLDRVYSAIPGISFPKHLPKTLSLNFGPQWSEGIATILPPEVKGAYTNLVSAVDEDGNDISGIRLPDLAVPLATYTGWNERHPECGGEDEVMRLTGSTFPFPRDTAARRATGDPRPSIAERYGSKADYLERFRAAAAELVAAHYVLAEDIDGMVEGARRRYEQFTESRS